MNGLLLSIMSKNINSLIFYKVNGNKLIKAKFTLIFRVNNMTSVRLLGIIRNTTGCQYLIVFWF